MYILLIKQTFMLNNFIKTSSKPLTKPHSILLKCKIISRRESVEWILEMALDSS